MWVVLLGLLVALPAWGGLPGLTGTTGDDLTLGAILSRTKPAAIGRTRMLTLYVDPAGSDANDGLTAAAPKRSLEAIGDLLRERACGVEIVMTSGATWDTVGTNADIGACTGSADDCGIGDIVTSCDDADLPAVWIHSSVPGSLAIINVTTNPGVEGVAVLSASAATAGGWVIVEGVQINAIDIDGFKATNAGQMLVANVGQANTTDGFQDLLFEANGSAARLLAINSGGSADDPATNLGVASSFAGGQLQLINANLTTPGNQNNEILATALPTDAAATGVGWLVGRGNIGVGDGTKSVFGVGVFQGGAPAEQARADIARVSLRVDGLLGIQMGCFRYQAIAPGSRTTINTYQTTCTGQTRAWDTDGTNAADALSAVKVWYQITDDLTGGPISWTMQDSLPATLTTEIVNSLWDQDDRTNEYAWASDSNLFDTIAAWLGACGAQCTRQELSDITASQWIPNSNLSCQEDQVCHQGATEPYTYRLAVPIPAFWAGAAVTHFRLLSSGPGSIGWR